MKMFFPLFFFWHICYHIVHCFWCILLILLIVNEIFLSFGDSQYKLNKRVNAVIYKTQSYI